MIESKYPEASLKIKYPLIIRYCAVITLIGMIGFLAAFPKFSRETAEVKKVERFIEVENVAVTEQVIEQAAPPSRPTIPVEAEDEDLIDDIDFEMADFDSYEADEWAAPPPPPEEDGGGPPVKFIPFDEAPVPLGGFAAIQRNVVYPEIAQEAGIEGQVVVQAFIDEKGRVGECTILKGVPNTGLDEAAIDAIRKTKFQPAKQRDRNVGVYISIPVIFKLRNN